MATHSLGGVSSHRVNRNSAKARLIRRSSRHTFGDHCARIMLLPRWAHGSCLCQGQFRGENGQKESRSSRRADPERVPLADGHYASFTSIKPKSLVTQKASPCRVLLHKNALAPPSDRMNRMNETCGFRLSLTKWRDHLAWLEPQATPCCPLASTRPFGVAVALNNWDPTRAVLNSRFCAQVTCIWGLQEFLQEAVASFHLPKP